MDALQGHPFYELAAVLALAALIGGIGYLLRQPLIIGFLAVGVLVGPAGIGLVSSYEQVHLLADIGIALLLFIVGLRLDLHLIKTTGPVALAAGLGQVVFTAAIGFAIALLLGWDGLSAAFIAVALTFSSTIIIVKLLSDKREIDSLHGRIAVGMLIVQDVMAILAMILLVAIGGEQQAAADGGTWWRVTIILGKGLLFVGVIAALMRWVLPWLLERLARYQELMVLFAIAWAITVAAAGDMLGFSKEIGAFLAGVAMASTHYREAIGGRLVTLRDFLLLFFFIALGARLEFSEIGGQITSAIVFSLFVLVGNPLIVMAIMGVMGYRRRTGFLTGLTVAQISEFSLILAALGLSLGHIESSALSLITVVGVITICASTYLILYGGRIYPHVAPLLKVFERSKPSREAIAELRPDAPVDIVLVGIGRYGGHLIEHLLERGSRVLGVDFDPEVLRQWRERGVEVLYGDASDPEFVDQLPLQGARWVVSTTHDRAVNLSLLQVLRARGYEGRIALTARSEHEAQAFAAAGAEVVLRPFRDAAEQGADALAIAMRMQPLQVDWPLALRETRLRPGSVVAGQRLDEVGLYREAKVSVLAVGRGGRVHLDLDPAFRLYPGDHLVLMGSPEQLIEAQSLLDERETAGQWEESPLFAVAEIRLPAASPCVGRRLSELRLRQRLAITILGIRRGQRRIMAPTADETLQQDDLLVVVGRGDAMAAAVPQLEGSQVL